MSERPAPSDAQREPPFPDHDTVMMSLRYPDMTCHYPHEDCRIQEPHLIAECGRFGPTDWRGRMSERKVTDLRGCARCGGDHERVEWLPIMNPVEDSDGIVWNHWAPCPTNGEPILMRIVEEDGTY